MSGLLDWLESALIGLLDWAEHRPARSVILISSICLLVLLPGLSEMPVTDRDEARFAQASKQMLETGDLIDIRFQDQPRWKKPVGIYWLQAASASLFGGVDAPIWAYRAPSALAAWLTALLVLWGARPLIGPRGALLAGLMMSTALLLVAEGHIAKTDAALAASAAAALGGLAHVFFGQGRWGAALMFWLAIAASILLKGPIVPVIAAFALAALWWRRELRGGFRRLHILPGLVLVAVLVAPWLVAIWHVSDGAFFAESLGKDMGAKLASGQENHWGPPGLYLALVWVTAWPWAALIPLAAGWIWATRRAAWLVFLAAWVVPFWLILEIVPTKLPHYVLPLFPALVIVLAGWVVADQPPRGRWTRRIAAALAAVPGVVLGLAVIVLPLLLNAALELRLDTEETMANLSPGAIVLGLAAAVAALAAAIAVWQGKVLGQIAAGIVAMGLILPAVLQFGLPNLPGSFPSPRMAAVLLQYASCGSGPAFVQGYHEPSLVFATETGLRMADPQGAYTALQDNSGAMLLIEDRWEKIMAGPPPGAVLRAEIGYFNYNRGKAEISRLYTPDDPRWAACTDK